MITGFRVCRALLFALAIGLTLLGEAGAQDSQQEFIESIIPGLKQLREFSDAVEEKLTRITNLLDRAAGRNKPLDESGPAAEPLEPLPDPQAEKKLREEFNTAAEDAYRRQFNLVDSARKQLRLYVSLSVDKCKERVAAGDEIGARANCGIAEKKMEQCNQQVAPAINKMANRLTAKFKSYRSSSSSSSPFETIYCDSVFSGLDDPGKILSKAEYRLTDESCYLHSARVEKFAKTGDIQNVMGKDDTSVPAYLDFIRRKCPERISDQAKLAVAEATSLKADEERKRNREAAEARQKITDEAKKELPEVKKDPPAVATERSGQILNDGAPIQFSTPDTGPFTRDPPLRLRADKPVLYAGEGVTEFYRDWDDREEALYNLGEKMCEWGTFDLYAATGREEFLRNCDARIVAARSRVGAIIASCGAMRRGIAESIDKNELDRAADLVERFQATCGGENPTYADLARLYKSRIAEARDATPILVFTNRGKNAGTDVANGSISEMEEDKKNPGAREARERAAELRAAEASADAQESADNSTMLGVLELLGTVLEQSQNRGSSIGSAAIGSASNRSVSSGSNPACTPGPGYDAHTCSCQTDPKGAGCPGAVRSSGPSCWGQGPECLRRYKK